MREDEFRFWLTRRKLKTSSVNTAIGRVRRLEAAYGSLSVRYDEDRLSGLIEEFSYSAEDERQGRANDTSIAFTGRLRLGFADMKKTLRRYQSFLDEKLTA